MIKELWKILFGGCEHKWKIIQQDEVYQRHPSIPTYIDYVLQCEKCGNIKKKRT